MMNQFLALVLLVVSAVNAVDYEAVKAAAEVCNEWRLMSVRIVVSVPTVSARKRSGSIPYPTSLTRFSFFDNTIITFACSMSQMIISSLPSIVRLMINNHHNIVSTVSINQLIHFCNNNNNNNTEKPRLSAIPAIPPKQAALLWFFRPLGRHLWQFGQPDRGPARALGVRLWPLPNVRQQRGHLLQPQTQPGPLPQGQPPAQVLHPVRSCVLLSIQLGRVLLVHARPVLQVGESMHPGRGWLPLPGVVLNHQSIPTVRVRQK